jgi:RNA polymerase sigma factor (TIGR02999 family)
MDIRMGSFYTGFVSDVTRLLGAIEHGDPRATEELLPLVYEELRKLAAHKMAHEPPGQTLQPTALVHEAWLRLVESDAAGWENRGHFIAAAAEAMRRILIERARRRLAAKRGGGAVPVELEAIEIPVPDTDENLLRVHEALESLAEAHPRKAELIKLRYFAGLSFEEAARTLGIAVPTAKQWWTYARAWLRTEIARQRERSPAETIPQS